MSSIIVKNIVASAIFKIGGHLYYTKINPFWLPTFVMILPKNQPTCCAARENIADNHSVNGAFRPARRTAVRMIYEVNTRMAAAESRL
jgi:hypothetical protein